MSELADDADSKSVVLAGVWVRVPLPAPDKMKRVSEGMPFSLIYDGGKLMSDLKQAWKQTAKSFILAFNDLSVSVFDTAKAGYDAAMEWAKKDNVHVQTDGTEIPAEESADETADETQ